MLTRIIEKPLNESLYQGKTIIIYGPRQVGKTTLLHKILSSAGTKKTLFLDAESANIRDLWRVENVEVLVDTLSRYDLIGIDEAQRILGIGSILKYLHDHLPRHIQIIATGSSAFDLSQKTRESMVGRVRDFFLTPFTIGEIIASSDIFSVRSRLIAFLQYGLYPLAITGPNPREEDLLSLAGSLLYRDILELDGIRKPQIILDLLRLIALQIGKEVSYNELAQKLNISVMTVQKYIYLLEESFIIFSLRGFSRNLRNEITKSPKIYFYDIGVRNALINNFNPPSLRSDIGDIWENFVIAERIKQKKSLKIYGQPYFWRTHTQKEIDYIEDYDGVLHAYEIKWNEKKTAKLPKEFATTYPENTFQVIHRENWIEFFDEKRDYIGN